MSFGSNEVEGKQNSEFSTRPVIKCYVIPSNSKLKKTWKKLFAFCWLAHTFSAVSKKHDLIMCKLKVNVVVSPGS